MYQRGDGLPKDAAEAYRWYRMAAELGHADAQVDLGWIYANGGGGVPRDSIEAMTWFRKAAAQGNTEGQRSVGYLYSYGHGVPKNGALAVNWTKLAAEQRDTTAMRVLAVLSWEGDGVPRDLSESYAWLRLAVMHDDREKDSEARLKAIEQGSLCAGMKPGMFEEARERALRWRPKSKEEVAGELAALLESTAPARNRPDPRTIIVSPEQLVASCVASIHARLKEIREAFPELSGRPSNRSWTTKRGGWPSACKWPETGQPASQGSSPNPSRVPGR
jgi:TPR repeat protein